MYKLNFIAKVLEKGEIENKKFVILDNTYFYPDGKGGQLGDRGKIEGKDILYVKEINGKIFHFLSDFPEKDEVICEIDKNRRVEISREHTAQHILSRVILNLFNLETLSFHMGEEYSTIDIPYIDFKDEDIEKIELNIMKVIEEGRLVKKYFIDESEARKLNLRKEEEIKEKIRIVEIENFDITMCGGTHVDNTKDILIFKLTKTEKIKGNLLRIYFKSGYRAYSDYLKKDYILKKISKENNIGIEEIDIFLRNLKDEREENYKKLKLIKEEFIKLYLKSNNSKKILENIDFLNQEDFVYIGKELLKNGSNFVFLYNKDVGVIFLNECQNLNYHYILNKLKENFNIKGGGKDFISIKLNNNGKEIEKFLCQMIE
ncbi:MAG: alanyl-tRNA editing protein [Caldisericia bacterium]|nr:alanyl-tRNA editing protein [Caldisericia bacterium]